MWVSCGAGVPGALVVRVTLVRAGLLLFPRSAVGQVGWWECVSGGAIIYFGAGGSLSGAYIGSRWRAGVASAGGVGAAKKGFRRGGGRCSVAWRCDFSWITERM